MKKTLLPKELLNLPKPWGVTHPQQRREQIGLLNYEFNSIKTALNVLERSLHSLSQLTYSKTSGMPEEMITYWPFTAEWLAEKIPTFDKFDLVKVEQFLISDEGIDSPSPNMIRDVAEYWVWWITWDIEKAALNWVQDALMKTRDLILISHFLHITSRYWQKIEPRFAQSLLRRSATIGWQKALPLLESVEQHPLAKEAVKETVQNYRRFVLKNREKWLLDSDLNEGWADKRPLFLPPQPFDPSTLRPLDRLGAQPQGTASAHRLKAQPAFGQLAIAHR